MSRRKHVLQSLEQEIEPPGEGQHIVRALGSRGSNIIEVEFPDGRTTLCLLPAKFHKKLWIKRGNYIIVEDAADADSRVTGQILAVLFADHVKQLKKMPGVWPPEFESSSTSAAANRAAEQLAALGISERDSEEERETGAAAGAAAAAAASSQAGSPSAGQREQQQGQQHASGDQAQAGGGGGGEQAEQDEEEEGSSSEDDLPPIPRFQNRKIIEYEVSDSDDSDDD